MLNIYALSDIHGHLVTNIPKCDVVCICGDIINLNDQKNFESSTKWWKTRFVKWVNELQCSKVIVTAGNHDFLIENLYNSGRYFEFKEELNKLTNDKLVFLLNEEYCYKGVNFYGCPYIMPIGFGKWAFESTNEKDYEIPHNLDVLITHDNPQYNTNLSFNDAKYHFYGHWHEGYSIPSKNRYNCSILNDCYNVIGGKFTNVFVNEDIDKINNTLEILEELKVDASEETEAITSKEEYNILLKFLDSEIAKYIKYKQDIENEKCYDR